MQNVSLLSPDPVNAAGIKSGIHPIQSRKSRLKNQVALITGADTHIGRKIANLYARQGAKIMLCGLNFAKGNATANKLKAAGGEVRFILADISEADDVKSVVNETIATYGRLDTLFNSGNPLGNGDASTLMLRPSIWDRMLEINLKGTFLACQYALPYLIRSDNASIINLVPFAPSLVHLAASASRGGLLSMTRAMADEVAKYDVRANLIWPKLPPQRFQDGRQFVTERSCLPHPVLMMAPRDSTLRRSIARAALYLACDESKDITGSVVVIVNDYPSASHPAEPASLPL